MSILCSSSFHKPNLHIFFLLIPRHPRSTLFPYTTLFRSFAHRMRSPPGTLMPPGIQKRSYSSGILTSRITKSFRSEEHTSELQSRGHLVCRLLLEKKKSSLNAPAPPSNQQYQEHRCPSLK